MVTANKIGKNDATRYRSRDLNIAPHFTLQTYHGPNTWSLSTLDIGIELL